MNAPARRGWFDAVIDLCAVLAGAALVALTLLVCVDVAARSGRLFPMPWSLDVAEYLLYHITFLGAPWVLRDGGHIAIDLLVGRLRGATRRRVDRVANGVGTVICAALLYFACRVWWASFRSGTQVYETFVFPEWTLFTAAPFTFALLLGIYLRWLVRPPADPGPAAPTGH